MSKPMIEVYGQLADAPVGDTERAGRYPYQERAERLIVAEVIEKLALRPDHTLLEIGCGAGNLLIPLSFAAKSAVGIDHPSVVAKGRERFADKRIAWLGGSFPETRPEGTFDRILVYGVVLCLADLAMVERFIDAAFDLLAPEGRMLVGDLPIVERKQRFRNSRRGKEFEVEWQAMAAKWSAEAKREHAYGLFQGADAIGQFTDAECASLLMRYRARGCHAYLLPQDPELPFGHTREDLLIVRP